MKNLFIILYIMVGCFTKESANNDGVYQISIISLKESDKPYPIVILTNQQNNKSEFPKHYYQLQKEDLKNIEKKCSSVGNKKSSKSLLLIEIRQGVSINKYFFDKKQGVDILKEIQKQTLHYKNEKLANNILYLQKITVN